MRAALSCVLVYVSVAWSQAAQRTPAPAPVYGTVTGRITCVDTNGPARLASVTLQTIDIKPDATTAPTAMPTQEKMMHTYQTSLNGTFTIPKVVPGTYYVVIQQSGYVSPITQFTQAELQQPTPEILAKIIKAVPTITVEANKTATIETRIARGADFSGTIRYDDGTPVGGTYVTVLSKEIKDGKDAWVSNHNGSSTDDLGHYRITGLPAGEFLMEVSLSVMDSYVSNVIGGSRSSMNTTRYSLSFYSGDVARKDKGKSIKLKEEEQRDAADITIPVSKLHSVSGTLTEGRSGHIINAGDIALKYADGIELTKTKVDPDNNNTFHFDYIPEGEYTLVVTQTREVIRDQRTPPIPGMMTAPWDLQETLVRAYGDTTQPLIVQSEISGIVVTVPANPAKTSITTAH